MTRVILNMCLVYGYLGPVTTTLVGKKVGCKPITSTQMKKIVTLSHRNLTIVYIPKCILRLVCESCCQQNVVNFIVKGDSCFEHVHRDPMKMHQFWLGL